MPPADTVIKAAYVTKAIKTYSLTVNKGSGSGLYAAGAQVVVTANAPGTGYTFSGWVGATGALSDASAPTTVLTMPPFAAEIAAAYASKAAVPPVQPQSKTSAGKTPPAGAKTS